MRCEIHNKAVDFQLSSKIQTQNDKMRTDRRMKQRKKHNSTPFKIFESDDRLVARIGERKLEANRTGSFSLFINNPQSTFLKNDLTLKLSRE